MLHPARLAAPLACLALTSCGGGGSGGGSMPLPMGAPEAGRATYYAADGSGACSFDPSPGDLDVAAMDAPEWNGSGACGACVWVPGPKGSVTVRIVDLCPECEAGHLDLSQEAFAKIADPSAGNVPITWTVVPCAVTGDLSYEYKDGTNQWWTAIQVRNSRRLISSLEWMSGGSFTPIPRETYNYFVVGSGVGPNPIQPAKR
jgi:expansin